MKLQYILIIPSYHLTSFSIFISKLCSFLVFDSCEDEINTLTRVSRSEILMLNILYDSGAFFFLYVHSWNTGSTDMNWLLDY